MNRFAELLDSLLLTPSRNGKLRLMREYFASQPDPERGWALAALTSELVFAEAKPTQVRALAMARVDAELFAWSLDFVGDLAETVSLIWPDQALGSALPVDTNSPPSGLTRGATPSYSDRENQDVDGRVKPGQGEPLKLSEIVETLRLASRGEVGAHLAGWLDRLEIGRAHV